MILERSLTFIRDQLDLYLKQRAGVETDRVALSELLKQNGDIAIDMNTVGIALVNIEEERIGKQQEPYQKIDQGTIFRANPEIRVNLFLLFVARFSKYDEAVKAVSNVISFFQGRNVFERTQYPTMDPSIDKLIFEMQTMNFEQMNHLWGALGAKYMPSVLYKMRMLTIREEEIQAEVLPVKSVNINKKSN
ncbi:MAG: DUF4255 domain-containing protein [Balneolaceae bacterium]|nr:DUF4255 domain-containing protein [Balneolaceae bacterium]